MISWWRVLFVCRLKFCKNQKTWFRTAREDCNRLMQSWQLYWCVMQCCTIMVKAILFWQWSVSHWSCKPLIMCVHGTSWFQYLAKNGFGLSFVQLAETESWNGPMGPGNEASEAAFVATSKIWYQSPANIAQWWLSLNLHEPVMFRFECNIVDQWSSIQQEIHCYNTVDYCTHGWIRYVSLFPQQEVEDFKDSEEYKAAEDLLKEISL